MAVDIEATPKPAELSRGEFLIRRLLRPRTYPQIGRAAVDRLITWPKVNTIIDARARDRGEDFFFVQVGANDGKHSDPINSRVRQQHWNGLLVEPVPRYFNALMATYAGQAGLRFANVAVSHEDGTATMHAINPNNSSSSRLRGSSSLDRGVIDTSAWVMRDAERVIEPITVPTQRLTTLLGSFGIQSIDLLVVDTEGHDGVVVNQALDLEQAPSMVLYEHMHLPRGERLDLEQRLSDEGFGIRHMRRDTFAWQQSYDASLTD